MNDFIITLICVGGLAVLCGGTWGITSLVYHLLDKRDEVFLCSKKFVDCAERLEDGVLHYLLGVEFIHHDVKTSVIDRLTADVV